MIHEATAMSVRQNLGELLNEVQYRHDSILITRAGKPVAALVDIVFFEKIRRMRKQFETLSTELEKAFEDESPSEVENEMAKAVKRSRKK
jgi:prevent-host-death family protein